MLRIAHVDTCLPDFWGGHHRPWVCVPVDHNTTHEDLTYLLRSAIVIGEVQRVEDDEWHTFVPRARLALERMMEYGLKHNLVNPLWPDLGPSDHDGLETVHAYFIFEEDGETFVPRARLPA